MSADPVALQSWSVLGQHARVRFDVVADQLPGLLPRLLAPFARRDLAPDSLHAEAAGDGVLRVQIGLASMPADQVHGIEGNLAQVLGVRSLRVQREITGRVRRGLA